VEPLIPYIDIPVLHIPLPWGWEIPLHGFGILVAMGFIIGGEVAKARARALQLDPDVIHRLISWLVVGTLVGGHVGYGLMYKFDEYMRDPVQFLYVWQGLSSYGGFVTCVPLSIWYFRKEKVPIWPYLDCLAHGMAIGWFFGRMGCFAAHDHPGTPADDFFLGVFCRPVEGHTLFLPDWLADVDHRGAWGACLSDPTVNATHDMGLYEALFSLIMFFILRGLDTRAWVPGFQVLLLGAAYAPVRFAMDFLRPDTTDNRLFGLTPAQYWSVIFLILTVAYMSKRLRSGDSKLKPDTAAALEAEAEAAKQAAESAGDG
jgi:phosphatidylglycerol:prolipoprotein diacylglycerol transferase